MLKSIFGIAVAATAIILPDFAHAGSGSDTASASFTVLKQCNLLVTDLELGTFSVDQTWDNIGGLHGKYNGTSYTAGTGDLIKFGVINCDPGTLYNLQITGSSATSEKGATLKHEGKAMVLWRTVKKIGSKTFNDSYGWSNAGADVSSQSVLGTGSGEDQDILGTLTLLMIPGKSTAAPTDKLGAPGVISDTLKYTLSF